MLLNIVVTIVLLTLFVVGRAFGDKEKAREAGRLFRLKSLKKWRGKGKPNKLEEIPQEKKKNEDNTSFSA